MSIDGYTNEDATKMVSFSVAVESCFKNIRDFDGRASRAELWWCLFFLGLVDQSIQYWIGDLSALYPDFIGLIVGVSVAVRRLHDTGRTGWWLLLFVLGLFFLRLAFSFGDDVWGVIMFLILGIISIVMVLYWFAIPGSKESNQYGEPI